MRKTWREGIWVRLSAGGQRRGGERQAESGGAVG